MAEQRPAPGALDRIAAFRFVYLGIFAYVLLSLGSLELLETQLQRHFEEVVARAVRVSPAQGPVIPQIQDRITEQVHDSAWVRLGGARVNVIVLGGDGSTPIYLGGRTLLPPPGQEAPEAAFREAVRLLPPIVTVGVTVPPDSLLAGSLWVGFGAILVPVLFLNQRRLSRREQALFEAAVAARDATAERARSIQTELDKVRRRLEQVEPAERAHAEEISTLQKERETLQQRLAELAEREARLRERAVLPSDLDRERQALEDLLEDAVQDLESKESEIRELQERLKRASRAAPARGRGAEQIAKRMRTLYPRLEIDDRAIQDIAALGDEGLRLRAEESLKRLDADPGQAGVRRKVGGLPPQLSIFELGFAGKGRIYYARGRTRPFRVLAVGGKASQKADLEYLSRLTLD